MISFAGFSKVCKCTLNLRECERLEGSSNFIPWKLRVHILMEEVNILENGEKEIVDLTNMIKLYT